MDIKKFDRELSALTIACQGEDTIVTFAGGAEDPGVALSMLMASYCEILRLNLKMDVEHAVEITEGAIRIAYATMKAKEDDA